MSYTVLARRYRSTTFDDVIGQDHVAQTLKRAIESGRIAHAYLFCGTRGVGKTSMARILAKALNCESSDQPTVTPCGKCNSCVAIARGDDMDVIEIDAASNRGIDNIRDLISNSQYRPTRSRFKIYIIDEVHGLSKDAFNALLKVLEEPPSHVKFILATTEPEKVLPTILSRCQRYDFRNISTREIADHLNEICRSEKIKADSDALLLIAKAGAGSMRDALSLLDRMLSAGEKHLTLELVEQLLGLPRSQLVFQLAGSIGAGDVKAVLKQAHDMVHAGQSVDSLLATLIEHLRNLLILKTCGMDSELVEAPGISLDELKEQVSRFDAVALTQDITILEELRRQIRQSQAGRALLDATLVRLALADQFASIGELLGQARGGEGAVDLAAQKKNGSWAAVAEEVSVQRPVSAAAVSTKPIASAVLPAISAVAVPAPDSAPSAASERSNVEVVSPRDLPRVWQSVVGLLQGNMGLQSIVSHGTLVGLEDGTATIRYGAHHETFVRLLDRNGKKELLRDGLSQVLGEPVRIQFEVEAAPAAQPGEPWPETAGRTKATAEPAAPEAEAPRPAAVAIAAPVRVTQEMVDEIRESEPVVRLLMDTLGATIVRIE